jgi:ribosomal protein L1
MNEEVFNLEMRKFLKKFGITAQREIERAVQQGIESGRLKGGEALEVRARLEIDGLGPGVVVDGTIRLE